MPQLGESVHEGTISKWLVKPGDKVVEFEPMLEVDTDKVSAEVPAPVTGILKEILAKEGETVQAGAEIAVVEIGGDGDGAERPPALQGTASLPEGAEPKTEAKKAPAAQATATPEAPAPPPQPAKGAATPTPAPDAEAPAAPAAAPQPLPRNLPPPKRRPQRWKAASIATRRRSRWSPPS